jgi:hypothetical protein
MANNYTQFSECIPDITSDERAWLERQLETDALDEIVAILSDPEGYTPEEVAAAEERGKEIVLLPAYRESGCLGFEHEFYENDFVLYTEESGDVEIIIPLVQEFIRRFRPDYQFTLTWAGTCSKSRIGEFGGGAIYVDRDAVDYVNTWEWAQRRKEQRS